MKKVTLTLLAALFLVGFGSSTFAQYKQNIPPKIAAYVAKHFPNNPIVEFERDMDDGRIKYEVELRDGTEIEFDHRIDVKEIESGSNNRPLPDSVVPKAILDYVKVNHPSNFVVKWERKRGGYEVELNNDLELKFNRKGKFIRYDD